MLQEFHHEVVVVDQHVDVEILLLNQYTRCFNVGVLTGNMQWRRQLFFEFFFAVFVLFVVHELV